MSLIRPFPTANGQCNLCRLLHVAFRKSSPNTMQNEGYTPFQCLVARFHLVLVYVSSCFTAGLPTTSGNIMSVETTGYRRTRLYLKREGRFQASYPVQKYHRFLRSSSVGHHRMDRSSFFVFRSIQFPSSVSVDSRTPSLRHFGKQQPRDA